VTPTEKRLADAHLRVAAAERAHAAANKAATAARDFAAEIATELAEHVKRDEIATASRAKDLANSLRSGDAPAFKKSPVSAADRVARFDAESRATSARQALEELASEEHAARVAVDAAKAELQAAARAVLSGEAESYAAKVVALEIEALSSRSQLEAELRNSAAGWGSNSAAKLIIESERAKARGAADLPTSVPPANAALDSARSIAAKVVALELEALSTRVRIEGAVRSGILGWGTRIALSQLAQRVVQENLSTAIAVKNSSEWADANKAADHWRARHAELMKHSDSAPVQGRDAS
jgi:hypothetical protein